MSKSIVLETRDDALAANFDPLLLYLQMVLHCDEAIYAFPTGLLKHILVPKLLDSSVGNRTEILPEVTQENL